MERTLCRCAHRNQVNGVITRAMKDWFAHVGGRGAGPLDRRLHRRSRQIYPENVLKVFEGLKLYLDAPGFVFVIGYDEGVITEAVASEKQYTQRATGRDYIEKIVQMIFRIPQPTDEEIGALLTHFMTDSQNQASSWKQGRPKIGHRPQRSQPARSQTLPSTASSLTISSTVSRRTSILNC